MGNALLELSQQQLVDCAVGAYGNFGCDGGYEPFGFLYSDTNPIELATNYPYTGLDGNCNYDPSLGIVSSNGFSYALPNSPFSIQAAVMRGPISVSIAASTIYF